MKILKKNVPIAIAFLMGIVGITTYYIPLKFSQDLISDLSSWERIIGFFALIIGIYSLLNYHYHKMRRKVPGWGYSVVVYVAMLGMVIPTFWFTMDKPEKAEFGTWSKTRQTLLLELNGIKIVNTQAEFDAEMAKPHAVDKPIKVALNTPDGFLAAQELIVRIPSQWEYDYIFVPLSATMFSLLAFYIASAAYRAFRARTTEATVLLITAIILMIGRVPIGEAIWSKLPNVTEWILWNPSMAAQRGIMIGIGLGMIATSLRIIFGIERTYMGGGD